METTATTITTEAQKYRDAFELIKRDDKQFYAFKSDYITSNNEYYEKLSDIVHSLEIAEDFIYEQIVDCLDWIIENEFDDFDTMMDEHSEVVDSSVDSYTSGLTEWLNSHNSHVYYLTEVLQDGCATDGFNLLAMAQAKCIEEIWHDVMTLFEYME